VMDGSDMQGGKACYAAHTDLAVSDAGLIGQAGCAAAPAR
jgi:hypothetical protein